MARHDGSNPAPLSTGRDDAMRFGLPERPVRVGRRGFMVTSLAVGFTLAAGPIRADAIVTDAEGLEAGEVMVTVADAEIPAYRSKPMAGGPFPVVLVVQEIFGVHEHIQNLTRRLAKSGYYAIAPELYARQGDVARMTDVQKILRDVVAKVPDAQVMSDLDATVAYAADDDGDIGRLAITGFCWGGRIVWLYAAHNTHLKAGAAWYGPLVGETSDLKPKNPVDIAAELKIPVLGQSGGADANIKPEHVEAMRKALAAGSSGSEIVVYPGVPHGFNADYRPSYREKEAKEAWARMLAWFKSHGAA
jgi:carboxymethylenebutenolidase